MIWLSFKAVSSKRLQFYLLVFCLLRFQLSCWLLVGRGFVVEVDSNLPVSRSGQSKCLNSLISLQNLGFKAK